MKTSTFALIFGIAYLAAGLLGLIPASLVPPPADAPATRFALIYGYFLGLFPVNVLHSALHIAIGVWGISAWAQRTSAMTYAKALAVLFALLALLGVIPGANTLFGLMPIHGHDVWLHAATAVIAAYFAWWHVEAPAKERRRSLMDRRQRVVPVARERRFGLADRRESFAGVHAA
jgi:hypothetical protein